MKRFYNHSFRLDVFYSFGCAKSTYLIKPNRLFSRLVFALLLPLITVFSTSLSAAVLGNIGTNENVNNWETGILNTPNVIGLQLGGVVFIDGNNDCMNGGPVDQPYTSADIILTIERESLPGSGSWSSSFIDYNGAQYAPTINTAADGSYCFNDLAPGNYRIQVSLPQFWNFSDSQLTGTCTPPPNNGTANGTTDSDINPTGTVTNYVTLEVFDPKVDNLDIGIWKCMALGGTVWADENKNGFLDNMEAGLNIIQLEIEAGSNTWNVTTDFTPGSTFAGYWELSPYPTASVTACLSPGQYEVEVKQSNYDLPAGQLINWVSTIDGLVNNDIDGDDSGIGTMVTGAVKSGLFILENELEPTSEADDPFPSCDANNNMTVDFGFYFDCSLNQPNPPFTIYFNCEDSYDDPLCDIGLISNYCGTMPQTNNFTGPTPLCPTACASVTGITGTPHNTSWISFIAANACISLDILPSNCQQGTGLQWGIYEAIASPCNGGACVVCDGNCNGGGVLSVASCNFIPGNQYFLWLDGCNGTYCDYQFGNVQGAGLFTLPTIDTQECNGCIQPNPPNSGDPYLACEGATALTFCIETDSNQYPNFYDSHISDYTWEVDGIPLPNTTQTNCVQLDLSSYNVGDLVSVQMTNVGNCGSQSSPIWMVEIQAPETEDFGLISVCEDDFPFTPLGDPNFDGFGWQGTTISYDGDNTTNTYTALAQTGCDIIQTVDILDWPTAIGPTIHAGFCDISDQITVGTEIGQPTSYQAPLTNLEHTFPDGSLAGGGCDSVITLSLELIELPGALSITQSPPNVTYTFTPLNPSQAANYELSYEWIDELGMVVQSGGTSYTTPVAGCFDLNVYASLPLPATTNNGLGPCLFHFDSGISFLPNIDAQECSNCLPPNPPIAGAPFISCAINNATFCVDTENTSFPNFYDSHISTYSWEVDGLLQTTTTTNCVTLDLSNYNAGDVISVQMSNVGNLCNNQASQIWMIEIQAPETEDFGFFELCEDNFPFIPPGDPNMDGIGWEDSIQYDGNAMTNTYSTLLMDSINGGCGIVQTVNILDYPIAQGPEIIAGLCDPSDLFNVGAEIGQPASYPAPLVDFQHTFPNASLAGAGCDSVITITVELIEVLGDLTMDVTQSSALYSFSITNSAQVAAYNLTIEWLDDMGTVVQNGGETFTTSVPGCYDIQISASLPPPAITNNDLGPCVFVFDGPCFMSSSNDHLFKDSGNFLYQNKPNPFNKSTDVVFKLVNSGTAKLTIYDISGRVITEISDRYSSGVHTVTFDKSDLGVSSGLFFYHLESGDFYSTKKMILID